MTAITHVIAADDRDSRADARVRGFEAGEGFLVESERDERM